MKILDPTNIDISEDENFTNASNQLTKKSLSILKVAEEHKYTISIRHDSITLSRCGSLAHVFRCNRDIAIFSGKVSGHHRAGCLHSLAISLPAGLEEKHTSTLRILRDEVLAGGRVFVGIIFAIIFVVGLPTLIIWNGAEETGTSPDRRGWTILRQLANDDDLTTTVVQIQPEFAKDRSVYDSAVTTLCFLRKHGNICIIGFFLPGEDTPTTGRLVKWGDFKTLAVWWGNEATTSKEYTGWDCARAGVEGAPPSALCGVGVKEAYDVASYLGLRQGIGEFCNWPFRADIPPTLSTVLSEMARYGRKNDLKSEYAKMVEIGRNTGRTERGYNCSAYHAKIDIMVDQAVSSWRIAIRRSR
jgi:hypothetical protein